MQSYFTHATVVLLVNTLQGLVQRRMILARIVVRVNFQRSMGPNQRHLAECVPLANFQQEMGSARQRISYAFRAVLVPIRGSREPHQKKVASSAQTEPFQVKLGRQACPHAQSVGLENTQEQWVQRLMLLVKTAGLANIPWDLVLTRVLFALTAPKESTRRHWERYTQLRVWSVVLESILAQRE